MQLLNLFYLVLRNKIEKSLRCWIHCVSNAVLKRPTIASFCSRGICLCESITHLSGVSCWEGLKFSTHRWESSRGCNSLMRGRLNWQEVQDSAVRAIPVIGVKLTDVQKIMKTAMSLVKNTIILHESSKCVCISMLKTSPPLFFFKPSLGKNQHSPILKASAHSLAHAAEMGTGSWSSWGSGQRICWETSALQVPSVTTTHPLVDWWKGLPMPPKT